MCWSPLNDRNKLIFEDKTNRPSEIATKGLVSAREWDQAQSVQKPTKLATSQIRNDPRRDVRSLTPLSCSVDLAWDAATHRAGIAWIMNGSGSQVINNVASPFMAEILALQRGIERAIEAVISSITFFSDYLTLIRVINNKLQFKEVYGVLIDQASSVFASIHFSIISLVPRTWKLILL